MPQGPIKPVENYTNPFLVMAFINLLSAMVVLWGLYGYGAALALALGVYLLIGILERRRHS